MPRVSVIIPCYNHGRFIDGAVDSVLGQTFTDIEIVIVNDGSTDDYTNGLLANYDRPKARVIHSENRGPAGARNLAVSQCACEYILNLDADDRFRATFLERAVGILDSKPEVGIVGCWAQTYGDFRYIIKYKGGTAAQSLLGMQCSATSMYRRECWSAVGGYDETIEHYEDWDFYLKITTRGWVVEVIPEILLDYCKRRGSRCDTSEHDRPRFASHIVDRHLDLYRDNVKDVVYGKDKIILEQVKLIESIYASPRYKIGGLFTVPFQRIASLLRKPKPTDRGDL
jgi:glycosyltransferase involved in cell wall biosynthesis